MRCSILANTTNKFFSKVTLVPPPLKRLSFPPIKDAAVYEGEPFLNYGDYNQVLASADSSGKQFISLFGFKNVNITPTQWKTVNSVKFILSSSSISSELNRIELFTIDDDTTWNESDVNWKLKPTYSATAINNTEYPAGSTSIAFDLTDYFLKTFGNPSNKEFGFAMKAKYDTSSIVSFYSKEAISSLSPVLVISYYDMGVTPAIASINGNILPSFGIPDADIVCSVTPEGQYTDAVGGITTVEEKWIGTYTGLLFSDASNAYLTSDLGVLLKYLDFGILVAGKPSLPLLLNVTNTTSYLLKFSIALIVS